MPIQGVLYVGCGGVGVKGMSVSVSVFVSTSMCVVRVGGGTVQFVR